MLDNFPLIAEELSSYQHALLRISEIAESLHFNNPQFSNIFFLLYLSFNHA